MQQKIHHPPLPTHLRVLIAASLATGAIRFIPKHRVRQELPDAIAELFPGASFPAEKNLA